MAKEDDVDTALTQLSRLKTKNKALVAAKKLVEKAQADAKQLLQDKANLKSCT